jgi:hypothetical protein
MHQLFYTSAVNFAKAVVSARQFSEGIQYKTDNATKQNWIKFIISQNLKLKKLRYKIYKQNNIEIIYDENDWFLKQNKRTKCGNPSHYLEVL